MASPDDWDPNDTLPAEGIWAGPEGPVYEAEALRNGMEPSPVGVPVQTLHAPARMVRLWVPAGLALVERRLGVTPGPNKTATRLGPADALRALGVPWELAVTFRAFGQVTPRRGFVLDAGQSCRAARARSMWNALVVLAAEEHERPIVWPSKPRTGVDEELLAVASRLLAEGRVELLAQGELP